jgi:hypothetical protein
VHGYPDVGAQAEVALSARDRGVVSGEADLGDVELLVIPGAVEALLRLTTT